MNQDVIDAIDRLAEHIKQDKPMTPQVENDLATIIKAAAHTVVALGLAAQLYVKNNTVTKT